MSSSSRKMLQAAAGSAKKDYLEDYFNITHYVGNGSSVTTGVNDREIETGVDLSEDGGVMFFYVNDNTSNSSAFVCTDFGMGTYWKHSKETRALTDTNGVQSFTLDGVRKGFKMGSSSVINQSSVNYTVVTIRKKEKFLATMTLDGSTGSSPSNPLNFPPIAAWYFRIDNNDYDEPVLYWQNNVGSGVGLTSQYVHLEWHESTGVDTGLYGYGTAGFWDYTPGNTSTTLQLGGIQGNNFGKQGLLVMLGPGYEFSHNGNIPAVKTFGYTGDGTQTKGFNTQGSGYSNGDWDWTDDQWMFIKRADNSSGRWWTFFDRLGLKCQVSGNQYWITHHEQSNGSTNSYYGNSYNSSMFRTFNSGYEIVSTDTDFNSNGVFYLGLAVASPAILQDPISGQQVLSIRDGLNPAPTDYPNYGVPSGNGPSTGMRMGLFDSSDVSGISTPDFIWFNGDDTNGEERNSLLQMTKYYPKHWQKLNSYTNLPFDAAYNMSMNAVVSGQGFLTGQRNMYRDGAFINSAAYGTSVNNPFQGGVNNDARDVTFAFFKQRPNTMKFSYARAGTSRASFHTTDMGGPVEMVWVKCDNNQSGDDWYCWHKAFSTGSLYSNLNYILLNASTAKKVAASGADHPFYGYDPMLVSNNYVYVRTAVVCSGASDYYQLCAWRTNPGITKVGSYTGTGSTLQVDCGFSGPARFILIKRYDDNGRWYLFLNDPRSNTSGNTTDGAVGMVIASGGVASAIAWPYLGTSPSTSEQIDTENGVANDLVNRRWRANYFDSTLGYGGTGMEGGFKLGSHTDAQETININGASYLFLAIS